MQNPKNLTVIVGLGVTGIACLRYLHQRGHQLAVTDSRPSPPGLAILQKEFPNIPRSLGQLDRDLIASARLLVVSPGVSLQEPVIAECVAKGVPVLGDIELFVREVKAPIIAITGSNGKTTLTTLLGLMLVQAGYSAEVCGNIGRPVLEALNRPTPDYYVLELSSFQLETTDSLSAYAATVLNISPDHMDRYADVDAYRQAKQRIYSDCDYAIVNADEPEIWRELSFKHSPISFGVKPNSRADFHLTEKEGLLYLAYQQAALMPVSSMKLQGQHHWQNALAALAMGSSMGLPQRVMLTVLKDFSGLPHRCQWVGQYAGIHWYNDSKATNVGASVAAITSMGSHCTGKLILIAGGDGKEADFSPLKTPIQQYVDHVILLGKDAAQLQAALKDSADITFVDSMQDAVSAAKKIADTDDIVLLSPACASYDMFTNFEQRGDVFTRAVEYLGK